MEETRLGTTEVVVGQVVTLGWSACRLADPVDRKTLLKLFCLLDVAVDTLSDASVTALLGRILDLHTSAVMPDGWLHKHKGAARVEPDAGSDAGPFDSVVENPASTISTLYSCGPTCGDSVAAAFSD